MTRYDLACWMSTMGVWAALIYKVRDLRRTPEDPLKWAICATLFFAGAVTLVSARSTMHALDRAMGVTNAGILLACCLVVFLSVNVQVMVSYWRGPIAVACKRARWWLSTYALLIAVVITLFVLGDAPVARDLDFDIHYATTPYIAPMVVIVVLANACTAVSIALMCHQWAREAPRPWLRRGLRAIALSALWALLSDGTWNSS